MSNRSDPIQKGAFLVAPPILDDSNFKRSVVLLCEHSDSGSFGLILNQHIAVDIDDVLKDPHVFTETIHLGGPVQMDTLHFLHRFGDSVAGSVEVCTDVFWGGEFDALQDTLRSHRAETTDLRFYLGYAGWSEGQLEAEIDAGGWIVTSGDSGLVFGVEPALLWRKVMIRMGGEYALLANFPDEPRMN